VNLFNYATTNVITITPTSSIDRAISLMEEHDVHHLVVVHKGQVVGMVSDRDILISTGWMLSVERKNEASEFSGSDVIGPSTVQEIMSTPAICLDMHETSSRAAKLMVDRKISALPIVNGTELVGIITDSDLMKWLDALGAAQMGVTRFLSQPVSALMRASVVTATPETLLVDVTAVFRRRRIRHIPVLDGGLVMGMISDRDVRRSIGWSGIRDLQAEYGSSAVDVSCVAIATARDIMQTKVRWITRSSSLNDCLKIMLSQHVHSIPILEGGKLVGIITHTDFLKAVAQQELL
jgi:CBS domain-containing protein